MIAADDKQQREGLGVRKRINSAEGEDALQLLMKVCLKLVSCTALLCGIFIALLYLIHFKYVRSNSEMRLGLNVIDTGMVWQCPGEYEFGSFCCPE